MKLNPPKEVTLTHSQIIRSTHSPCMDDIWQIYNLKPVIANEVWVYDLWNTFITLTPYFIEACYSS
jgi:hypothetical protein